MSSLFRNPDAASSDSDIDSPSDISSSDDLEEWTPAEGNQETQLEAASSNISGNGQQQQQQQPQQQPQNQENDSSGDSSNPSPSDGDASIDTQTGLMDLDVEGHATMMTTSLLEFYCLTRAAEMLNAKPGSQGRYDRNHPRVQALGKKLYMYKSQFLSSYGMVAGGVESDDWAPVRQNYRESLDIIGRLAIDSLTPSSSRHSSRAPSRGPSSFNLKAMANDIEKNAPSRKKVSMFRSVGSNESSPTPPPNRIPLRRQITDKVTAETARKPTQGIIEMMASGAAISDTPLDTASLHSQVYGVTSASRYATEFEEEALLGRGSYGAVYRAKHHVDGQMYAVKKIPLSEKKLRSLQDKGFHELESILREIRTLARLEHKNVVRYFGAWVEYGKPAARGPKRTNPSSSDRDSPSRKTTVIESTHTSEKRHTLLEASKSHDTDEMSFGEVFDQQDYDEDDDDDDNDDNDHDDGIVFADPSSQTSTDENADEDDAGESTDSVHPLGARSHLSDNSPETLDDSSCSVRKSTGKKAHQESDSEDIESIPRSFGALRRRRAHFVTGGPPTPTSASEDLDDDIDIFSDGLYSAHPGEITLRQKASRGEMPMVTLHIQMSLHPLSLARFLTPPISISQIEHHCFHLIPSLRLFLGILDGVEYLHSIGMVHRDLKPANIFLSHSTVNAPIRCPQCIGKSKDGFLTYNTPRIGDFGLVAEITRKHETPTSSTEASENSNKRRQQRPVGTEFYRPPLVPTSARANSPYSAEGGTSSSSSMVDESLDVYALGVILFELLYKFDTRMERMFVLSSLTCSGNSRLLLAGPRGRSTSKSPSPSGSAESNASESSVRPMLPPDFEKKIHHTISVEVEGEEKEICLLRRLEECILGLVEVNSRKRWTCEDARKTLEEVLTLI